MATFRLVSFARPTVFEEPFATPSSKAAYYHFIMSLLLKNFLTALILHSK